GLEERPGAFGEDVGILAERVFAQKAPGAAHAVLLAIRVEAGPRLDDVEGGMMDDGKALWVGLGLDFLDPTVLCEAGLGEKLERDVRADRRDLVRLGHRDDQIGLPVADVPEPRIVKSSGRRHVGGVSSWRAIV